MATTRFTVSLHPDSALVVAPAMNGQSTFEIEAGANQVLAIERTVPRRFAQ